MGKNTYKTNTFKQPVKKGEKKKLKLNIEALKDQRIKLALGFFLILMSVFLLTAFVSYLFTGKADQSIVDSTMAENSLVEVGQEIENWLGYYGAFFSFVFIYKWFGLSAFFIPPLCFFIGYKILTLKELVPIYRYINFTLFTSIWLSLLLGYFVFKSDGYTQWAFLCGGMGYFLAGLFESLVGWGTFLVLAFSLLVFLIYFFNITSLSEVVNLAKSTGNPDPEVPKKRPSKKEPSIEVPEGAESIEPSKTEPSEAINEELSSDEALLFLDEKEDLPVEENEPAILSKEDAAKDLDFSVEIATPSNETEEPAPFGLKEPEDTAKDLVDEFGAYDPTLDLAEYKYPALDLMDLYDNSKVKVTKEELEINKNKIVDTLTNFKIGISSIKATIGPTVTLYEIIPEAGVKISKIKNLEDDIALSLAALGIRIIAPIPGKGTIGIEVPNKNREMVDIRSVLASEKFNSSKMELPVALGKTISNDNFVIDLAKMPHVLMAGATGQGKSVGLNVLLTCLLYKKHPSQLKFVLVDPKKVELSLFNKIERHFLAKLPDNDEAIITDTKKVVNTLNSLCIEMDKRYDLLKDGGARNIKEYNQKFVQRKLNPENGHRFLPYIVLVIDELADLMMTAGKEVETPIARLAQLARAIGIHLVVATQRPSVNVITGVIKANFPARLSFRVTSKIDSRTILDTGGADQLIGMGDMLFSQGSEITRLQCAYVDTQEVDRVCDFIGDQRGYSSAYILPEFVGDEEGGNGKDVDLAERDVLFDDAARLIVLHQQGSTSLIQRKLKLGYNRAGRIIDQLEAAGIVGPFEGSKAREVLVADEYALEQLLNDINSNA